MPPSTKHKAEKPKVKVIERKLPANSTDFRQRIKYGVNITPQLQARTIAEPQ